VVKVFLKIWDNIVFWQFVFISNLLTFWFLGAFAINYSEYQTWAIGLVLVVVMIVGLLAMIKLQRYKYYGGNK